MREKNKFVISIITAITMLLAVAVLLLPVHALASDPVPTGIGGELRAPTNLELINDNGVIKGSCRAECDGYYSARLYCVNEGGDDIECANVMTGLNEGTEYTFDDYNRIIYEQYAEGTRTFYLMVRVYENDTACTEHGEDPDYYIQTIGTDQITVTFSDVKLDAPLNPRWASGGVAAWDAVENAREYEVNLFKDGIYANVTRVVLADNLEFGADFSYNIGDASRPDAQYTFNVVAISGDLSQYLNSDASERSPALATGRGRSSSPSGGRSSSGTTASSDGSGSGETDTPAISEQLSSTDTAISESATPEEAKGAIDELVKNIDRTELQLAMQTSDETRDAINKLDESYQKAANIEVSTVVSEDTGIDNTKVSIQGAALNSEPNTKVALTVKVPEQGDTKAINTNIYKSVVQFDMDIINTETNESITDRDGNLEIPVTVTVPIPEGMIPENVRIIHYHHADDGFDVIVPRLNSDGTMSFTITHFSIIAFAEVTTEEDKKGDGTENDDRGSGSAATGFADDDQIADYAKPYVKAAADAGIIKGVGNNRFDPKGSATRSAFATMIQRAKGLKAGKATSRFPDVLASDLGEDLTNGVIACEDLDPFIVEGYPDGTFQPRKPVTRAEGILMIWRAAGKPAYTGAAKFTDLADWYAEAANWGAEQGIVNGVGGGRFDGGATLTRQDLATMLGRAIEKSIIKPAAAAADDKADDSKTDETKTDDTKTDEKADDSKTEDGKTDESKTDEAADGEKKEA